MIALVAAAWGCLCLVDDDQLVRNVRVADHVFLGLVDGSKRQVETVFEHEVLVLVTLKGIAAGARVVVATGADSCGLDIERGEWWVFFVYRGRADRCGGSERHRWYTDLLRDLWIEKEVSPALFAPG